MIFKKKKSQPLSPRKWGKEKKKTNKSGKISRRTDRLLSVIILLGLVMSSTLLIYPSFADALSSIQQSTTISSYADSLSGVAKEKLVDTKKQATEYNAYIRKKQKQTPFAYTGTGIKDKKYQKILNVSNDGIMGYIEIPKIDVSLPIGHGTTSDVLDSGSGHVYGTSVPIGGKSAHSVISAHTGLQSAKMFTDVDKLKKGDKFSIHVLNEIHYYRVISIRVETPHNADKYLQVQDGKDLVTLYTCTPYGVNTHRLLVTAESYGSKVEKKTKSSAMKINDWANRMTLKAALLAMVPLFILIAGLIRIFREELGKKIKKTRRKKESKTGKSHSKKQFKKKKLSSESHKNDKAAGKKKTDKTKKKTRRPGKKAQREDNTIQKPIKIQEKTAENEKIRQLENLSEWLAENTQNKKN